MVALDHSTIPSSFRFGWFVLPVFGIFATVGLLAGMGLSQRTAARAGVSADRLWDAGIVAVVAAYLASRLLLIATNWQAFAAFPMLVLTLPSLTGLGVLLAAVLTAVWLRWKRVQVLAAADAWASCAAVLAGFLELGHFAEGTDAGMPTRMPWGVHAVGDTVLGRTQPVQLFAGGVGGFLGGGAASFGLDMLRQPEAAVSAAPLDPSQVFALVAMGGGILLLGNGAWARQRPERQGL
jgi:phosphatidylglycerol:prolipoprotein diacylglycerol transferase